MIDTHAHLDFSEFDEDREEVIARFFSRGGKAIINVGVDLEHSRKGVEIAQKHKNIYAAVGFHPHEVGEKLSLPKESEFAELKNIAKNEKVKAIGEIGLDYFYYKTPEQIKLQKKLLLKQIGIAKEFNLPIVIHCREAWKDIYEIVKTYKINSKNKILLHCYSGEKNDTEKFLKLPNVYFSFSGNITYPKPDVRRENLAEAIRMIPLDKIMLDSDSPFLTSQKMRGKRNEPAYISDIAEKIAEIKSISVTETEKSTDKNAVNFFEIE